MSTTPAATVASLARDTERDRRVSDAVARARRSPFYAQHLAGAYVTGRADLARLPLTFKDHLRDQSPYGLLVVPPHAAWHYHEISGATGEPIATWCGLSEIQQMATIVHSMVPELSTPTVLLNRCPLFAALSFVLEEAQRHAGMCHIPTGHVGWDLPFTRTLDLIRRLKVTAVSCLPLEPILLRELAREEGFDLQRDLGSLQVILCGGAPLPPAMRRVIETDWNARIVEIYGSNETLLMGVGCTAGRTHLCHELLEFEVLDARTLHPVANGDHGVLTVTSLAHTVFPLVRYFTGDLVRVDATPCACGRPGWTVECLGRYSDVIEYGGAVLTPYALLDAAYEFAGRLNTRVFFVLVQRRGLRLLVEVDAPARYRGCTAERELINRLQVPLQVEYVDIDDVMDRRAMRRAPTVCDPHQISDWRGRGRRTITLMEAVLEPPASDRRTLYHLLRRQLRTTLRRRRFAKDDEV